MAQAASSEFQLPLQGRLALVTGASRGLGEGIAFELARRGASVAVGYTSPSSEPKIQLLAKRISELPHAPRVYPVQGDLSTVDGPQAIVDSLAAQFKSREGEGEARELVIDILVNNAGQERVKPLGEITAEDYHAVHDVNVRGVILLTQACLPYLHHPPPPPPSNNSTASSPHTARIINIGSVGARAAFKSLSLYTSSKAALEALTRSWAAELGSPHGTTVNCVNPGPVQSDMLDNIPRDIIDMQKATTPLQNRLGTVQEVADMVAMLASRDSGWITGQVISASGGWAMY